MNALYEIITDEMNGTVEQYIKVTYNETTVEYTITRDLINGGNISEVENHFENLPYIENGKVCYDNDLYILENLFKHYNTDIYDLDQYLWEMDSKQPETMEIELKIDELPVKINITLEIIENIYIGEE